MRAKIVFYCNKNLKEFVLNWFWDMKEQLKSCAVKGNILFYIIPCFELHLEGIFSVKLKTSSVKSASDILCSIASLGSWGLIFQIHLYSFPKQNFKAAATNPVID